MSHLDSIPAWYGKLPSLGDFASRRMSIENLELWDEWLFTGLAYCQTEDPTNWLASYLASPSWRFLLMPDSLGRSQAAHAGVLMPSVDRVGRYFPFALFQRLDCLPGATAGWRALLGWLHQLDDLAVDALQGDWPVERLEAELHAPAMRLPSEVAEGADASTVAGPGQVLDIAGEFAPWMEGQAALRAQSAWQGQTWWWSALPQGGTRLLIFQGLPQGDDFASLLAAPALP